VNTLSTSGSRLQPIATRRHHSRYPPRPGKTTAHRLLSDLNCNWASLPESRCTPRKSRRPVANFLAGIAHEFKNALATIFPATRN